MTVESPDNNESSPPDGFESTGNAGLDKRLSQPILRGDVGIDTAQVWMSAFLIFVVGLIGWSSSLRIPFQGDDQRLVRDNTALHSLATLPAASIDGAPQPLALLTLALNWAVAPGSAGTMRFFGLALHLVNGLLVFLLCRRLLPNAAPVVAMIAGMLFVLHPLASESILYVTGRGPVLGATLSLCSVLLFIRAIRDEAGVKAGALAASVFCFVFAVFADASAVVVPALLLAIHCALAERARAPWRVHVPYWGALLALAIYAGIAHGFRAPSNVPALFAQYFRRALLPYGLSIVHDVPHAHMVAGVGVLIAGAVVSVVLLSRRSVGGLGLFWLVLGLAYAAWAGPAIVERRAYFALAGLALLAPWLYEFVKPGLRPVAGIAAAVLVLTAGVASNTRTSAWRSEFDLWQDAAVKAPNSPTPRVNLGRILATQAETSASVELAVGAEMRLREALDRDAGSVEAHLWLGSVLRMQGKLDEALQAYLDVLRAELTNRDALLGAADALFTKYSKDAAHKNASRTLADALEFYRKADEIAPLGIEPLARLGAGLSQLGRFEAAEAALKRAAETAKGDTQLAQSLKNVEDARKRSSNVEQQAVALLKRNESDPAALRLVAQSQVLRGNTLGASYSLDSVWRTGAADFSTWVLTGFVRARLDGVEAFVLEHGAPPAKPAEVAYAWVELAKACAASGLWDAAEAYLNSEPARAEQGQLPLVLMAQVAMSLKQAQPQRARQYIDRACQEKPDSPAPWLALAEMAGAAKDAATAAGALAEAEKRGATPEDVQALRQKYSLTQTETVRTVIQ